MSRFPPRPSFGPTTATAGSSTTSTHAPYLSHYTHSHSHAHAHSTTTSSSSRPYTPPSSGMAHNNNNNNNNNSPTSTSSPSGTPKPPRHTYGTTTTTSVPTTTTTTTTHHHNPNTDYTHLPPPLLSTLRTSFHYLDKDTDGQITPSDLTSVLTSLSLPASTTPYFSSAPHPVNLASYLTHFSSFLGEMSSHEELLMAFEAFDDDDDGTVSLDELREAVMGTGERGERLKDGEFERAVRGFVRKRGLRGGKGGSGGGGGGGAGAGGLGGERFGYRDWVGLVCGKAGEGED